MRTAALKLAVDLAKNGKRPLAKLVAASIEVDVIVPSILTANLKKAGFTVSYRKGPGEQADEGDSQVGAWVLVTTKGKKGPVVVARAYSHDKGDALLQAVSAWLKEETGAKSDDALVQV